MLCYVYISAILKDKLNPTNILSAVVLHLWGDHPSIHTHTPQHLLTLCFHHRLEESLTQQQQQQYYGTSQHTPHLTQHTHPHNTTPHKNYLTSLLNPRHPVLAPRPVLRQAFLVPVPGLPKFPLPFHWHLPIEAEPQTMEGRSLLLCWWLYWKL